MKVGIIGAGAISASHIEGYQRCGATVVAIADRNEEIAREKAEKYGIARVFADAAYLLSDPEVEAVSIATPVSTHRPLVLSALAAGKHVLCEKPPAMSASEIEEMIAARDRAGRVLQFGFVCRYRDRIAAMRRAYREGRFGRLLFGEAGRLARTANPGAWFSDRRYTKGGTLFDAAIHEIDQLFYVIGYPKLRSVRAFLGYENPDLAERLGTVGKGWASVSKGSFANDVETSATVFAVTEDGTPLLFRATAATGAVTEGPYIKLTGSLGGAEQTVGNSAKLVTLGEGGFAEEEIVETAKSFDAQIAAFCATVEKGAENIAPAEDALALMRFYDAVYLSAELGQEVIL